MKKRKMTDGLLFSIVINYEIIFIITLISFLKLLIFILVGQIKKRGREVESKLRLLIHLLLCYSISIISLFFDSRCTGCRFMGSGNSTW